MEKDVMILKHLHETNLYPFKGVLHCGHMTLLFNVTPSESHYNRTCRGKNLNVDIKLSLRG